MAEPEHTIQGGFMTPDEDPFARFLVDANLRHEGEDPLLAAACQQVMLRGLLLICRHPKREWHRTRRERGKLPPKPLPPGKRIEIPPMNYAVPDLTDPAKIGYSGVLRVWGHLPSSSKKSDRLLSVEVWAPDQDDLTMGTGLAAINVSPNRVVRTMPRYGDVPGRRSDLNFVACILSKIETTFSKAH